MNLYIILAFVLVSILVAIIIVKVIYKSPNTSETYSVSDGNILISDSNGNLSLTPNILNDLQTQAQAQIQAQALTTLTTQVAGLTTQINNIINGTTHIQSLNVDGTLTVNSTDDRPIRMNKKAASDKTILISYQLNGTEYNANGLASDGNLWGSGAIPKGWFNPIS